MARARKTWQEKLNDGKGLPKIVKPKGKGAAHLGKRMLIPAPIEVDALMKRVRKGRVTTVAGLRKKLADAHDATSTCPLTTGIFAWIAANAAQESRTPGASASRPGGAPSRRRASSTRSTRAVSKRRLDGSGPKATPSSNAASAGSSRASPELSHT